MKIISLQLDNPLFRLPEVLYILTSTVSVSIQPIVIVHVLLAANTTYCIVYSVYRPYILKKKYAYG